MKRLLLPIILLFVGVGGGVGAGLMLGGGDAPASEADDAQGAEDEHAEEDDGHGEDDADDHAGDDGHGEDEDQGEPARVEPAGEGTEYVRINNQFVVPIVRNGAVRSLVVLSLSLEVDTGGSSAVFNYEPRLRDSFLRVMFAHANAGGFDGRFTEAEAMAPLRSALREAAQSVLGRGSTYDVLITDITRQDA
ncbi:hypothetical protein A8B78_05000 [Jannaschia sp. EhC01]|nr:hypothetical protein A8B78_05000 [Jannaschia sp. EhC01]